MCVCVCVCEFKEWTTNEEKLFPFRSLSIFSESQSLQGSEKKRA